MKKVILSLAVLFSVAMVSCGGNKTTETVDSETIAVVEEVETVVEDTVAPDSVKAETVVAAEAAVAETAAPAEAAK